MKKVFIFLLALTMVVLVPLPSFAARPKEETVEPTYEIVDVGQINFLIRSNRASVQVAYNVQSTTIRNVEISITITKKVALMVFPVELDGAKLVHVYNSTATVGSTAIGADINSTGTYIAAAEINVTNSNGTVSTEALSKTVVYS